MAEPDWRKEIASLKALGVAVVVGETIKITIASFSWSHVVTAQDLS